MHCWRGICILHPTPLPHTRHTHVARPEVTRPVGLVHHTPIGVVCAHRSLERKQILTRLIREAHLTRGPRLLLYTHPVVHVQPIQVALKLGLDGLVTDRGIPAGKHTMLANVRRKGSLLRVW